MINQQEIAKLTSLEDLRTAASNLQKSDESQIVTLNRMASGLLVNFNLSQLEEKVSHYIEEELDRSGLDEKISLVNKEAMQKLNEIGFFATKSSLLTGFFSSEFSTQDKKKWEEITIILSEIYDPEVGLLRRIQDHFLFQVGCGDLAKLFNKENLLQEEELFIRTILIKAYLINFRQLILPFYEIDDKLLIKFKKERISSLRKSPPSDFDNSQVNEEISLLNSQIIHLESQNSSADRNAEKFYNEFSVNNQNISAFNVKLNTGSVVLGSVETARYFTSFIGHKVGVEALKRVGTFGANLGGVFAQCLPFVSVLTEAGTQMNNNRIIYNYEKKLRTLEIIEVVKRNLLILERQSTDYYFNNLLNRLYEGIINRHHQTAGFINNFHQNYLERRSSNLSFTQKIKQVAIEYHENVSQISDNKNKEILIKESKITKLDLELLTLRNEINLTKRELVNITEDKQKEEERLNRAIFATQENLDLTKNLLQREKELIKLREKNADQAIKNTFAGDWKAALAYENEKRQELEMTVSVLLKKQVTLEEELAISSSRISSLKEKIVDEQDCSKALLESLSNKLSSLQRDLHIKATRLLELESQQAHSQLITNDYQAKITQLEESERQIIECQKQLSNYHDLQVAHHDLQIAYEELLCESNNSKETQETLTFEIGSLKNKLQVFEQRNESYYSTFLSDLSFSTIAKVGLIIPFSLFSLQVITSIISSVTKNMQRG